MMRYAIAHTRGIEDHEGHPARLRGGHGASQHGAGIAIEHDEAPPLDPLQGEVHDAPVNEPVLVRPRGFEGVQPRLALAVACSAPMTPVKKTSLKPLCPFICTMGRISIPSDFMSTMK